MTPDTSAAFEGELIDQLELDRIKWENTGNPLHIWSAIGRCYMIGTVRAKSVSGTNARLPGDTEPFPFPPWCMAYLGNVAVRIDLLMDGKDFRRYPRPFGDLEPSPKGWQSSQDVKGTLNPTESAEMVERALGVVRDGWNAFDRLKALESKELDEFSDDALRSQGIQGKSLMNILLEESGIQDERTMRQRLKDARDAKRAKPIP